MCAITGNRLHRLFKSIIFQIGRHLFCPGKSFQQLFIAGGCVGLPLRIQINEQPIIKQDIGIGSGRLCILHEFVVLAPGIAFRINLLKGYIYIALSQVNRIECLNQCICITEIPAKRLPLPINDYSCFEHLPGSEQNSNSLLNLFFIN